MKIAVTYENGNVFQHFGQSEYFKIFDIEEGKVAHAVVVSTNGNGHGALAGFLKNHGVEKLICGGIGAGAKYALAEAGIEFFGGVSGNVDEQVESLLRGELKYNPGTECNHHGEHQHIHNCGGHDSGCGQH